MAWLVVVVRFVVQPAAPYSSSATPVITPSWLSFRLRSSTTPPMGLSSKSPTPSYSQPSQSSETAVVIAGIVGIEVKKNDNDLWWIVKIPASSDGEERQLRRRSPPRLGSAT
uniref:Uncharacterized protein n=1 Tax=Brassica oleracea var. oleracea TaxID=109376 RepID=A0A0D3AQF6_BRAOL